MKNTKITPLYERLSRDDDQQGESNSISNQKQQLEDYARRNGFPNPTHFTDDGISGTRFDRPGFTAMMEQVEAGRVDTIIIKDMSRLGRDYLKVGQVMEILRVKGVRLIAINDNVDSFKGNYYIPDLTLEEQPDTPIGEYGRMRQRYLKEHRPVLYNQLLLQGKLYDHLLEVDKTANARMEVLMPQFMQVAGVTEELKAAD